MRFICGGDDDIFAWRQSKAFRNFSQVDVSLAFDFGGIIEEEILGQVFLVPLHLYTKTSNCQQEQGTSCRIDINCNT